jgi:hypothetical protein
MRVSGNAEVFKISGEAFRKSNDVRPSSYMREFVKS